MDSLVCRGSAMTQSKIQFNEFQKHSLEMLLQSGDRSIDSAILSHLLLSPAELSNLRVKDSELVSLRFIPGDKIHHFEVRNTTIELCEMLRSTFSSVGMFDSKVLRGQMQEVEIENGNIQNLEVKDSDFRNSSIQNSALLRSRFIRTDLSYSNFTNVLFSGTSSLFEQCIVSGSVFSQNTFIQIDLTTFETMESNQFEDCLFVDCQMTQRQKEFLSQSASHQNLLVNTHQTNEEKAENTIAATIKSAGSTVVAEAKTAQAPSRFNSLELLPEKGANHE